MVIFLVWIVCAIAAAMAASNKGRSGGGWFFLGLLFGPFALLFALVAGPIAPAIEARSIVAGESKKCPFCAEVIKAEAVVCRYCSRDLPSGLAGAVAKSMKLETARFEEWLAAQKPPIVDPTPSQLTELRAAYDYKRRNGEL